MAFTRLFDIIRHQQAHFPQEDAICAKEGAAWKKYSTEEVINQANKISLGLMAMGFKKDDKIAIIANNRPEWNFADLGILQIGAIDVPIYPTISPNEYKFIFNDADVKLAFVSDQDLFEKVNSVKDQIPSLQEIYSFDRVDGVKHWTEVQEKADLTKLPELEETMKSIEPDTLATLIYTSGTTGTPKGVMLSHRNIAKNVESTVECLPINETHRVLSFLPLCHSFERMVTYTYTSLGTSIYYAESMETIGDDIKDVKPHFFTSVPRLLEKVYDKILAKGLALTGVKRNLFFWALNLGLDYDDKGNNSDWYNFKLGIARKLIFSKWQEALGGELIGIVTGAAALQKRLARVFSAAGIMIREGYGLTETSPVLTFNRFEDGGYCFGTVGPTIPTVEVEIAEDGEIIARGPNIMMGYYNRQDLTDEVIDKDGWFHTGDIGEKVDGKFYKITDRKKELFKTSGGKYVAPQQIENRMKESTYIEQVMVLGENQRFVSALIMPDFERLTEWCKDQGLDYSTEEVMINHAQVEEMLYKEVDRLNQHFSHTEQIKKIHVVPHTWGIEGGEMTPTLKLKRREILSKYQKEIDAIYGVG